MELIGKIGIKYGNNSILVDRNENRQLEKISKDVRRKIKYKLYICILLYMEFFGTTDSIMQFRLYETIGFEMLVLMATVSNIESVKLSDLLSFSSSCPELDAEIRTVTHQQMDLEGFLIQTFANIKTKYAQKNKLVLQSEIDELEDNLSPLNFKKTSSFNLLDSICKLDVLFFKIEAR